MPVNDLEKAMDKAGRLITKALSAMTGRNFNQALADLQEALHCLENCEETAAQEMIAEFNYLLGEVHLEQGAWSEAQTHLTASIALARRLENHPLTATVLSRLGQNAFKRGHFDEARECLDKAVDLATNCGELSTLAFAHLWRGAVAALSQDAGTAERELLQAVTVAGRAKDWSNQARALNILGENARLGERYGQARDWYRQALDLYESIDNDFGRTMVIHNLGHLALMMDDMDNALAYYDQALQLAIRIDARPAALEIIAALATIAEEKGDTNKALLLLGLVYADPATPKEALHMFADPTLARLGEALSSKDIESGLTRGTSLDFAGVIHDLLLIPPAGSQPIANLKEDN